jgi:hypothetical protein
MTALRDGRECREDNSGALPGERSVSWVPAVLFERLRWLENEADLPWARAQPCALWCRALPCTRAELAAAATSSARGSCASSDRSISEVVEL